MQKVLISNIIVPPRVRADLGNLTELAEEIKLHGLLHPIVVTEEGTRYKVQGTNEEIKDIGQNTETSSLVPSTSSLHYTLIAGYRRLQAVQSLGWTEISVTVIDTQSSLAQFDMQLAENIKRKDLNPIEISEAILERKHRFEQLHGPIKSGGDHCSEEYQKSKLPNSQSAFPDFYEDTGRLLKMSPFSVYKFLQLNNLDADLKEQISNQKISYRTALEQQGERNRNVRIQKKSKTPARSFGLPNKEDIAPLQKLYQAAPNLMKLFMLVQHTGHTINRQQDKPLEYQNCELEFLFMFMQQLDFVIPFYQEVRKQLNQMQEQKLAELAAVTNPTQ